MEPRKTARISLPGGEDRGPRRNPHLTVHEGPDLGRDFRLDTGKSELGRNAGLTLTLNDPTVSGCHLELEVSEGGDCVLRDLGSLNGTLVNGRRVSECRLQHGDQIRLGSTLLKFEYKSADSSRYTRRLYEMATRDPLTGLLNRKSFAERLDQLCAHSARTGEPVALLMLDLDHFKQINDRYGHQTGDLVLCRVSEALVEGVRKQDVVARYGGEEFAVILPGEESEGALKMAERLRALVAEIHFRDDRPEGATISVGGAVAPPLDAGRPESLVEAADGALYRAKETGRNRCCIHPQR